MSPPAYIEPLLAEASARLGGLAVVATSSWGALPAQAAALVLRGDEYTVRRGGHYPALVMRLHALVPLSDALDATLRLPSTFEAERRAALGEAEQLLWDALAALGAREATAWASAQRDGDVSLGLVRPLAARLYATAAATVRFVIPHLTPPLA